MGSSGRFVGGSLSLYLTLVSFISRLKSTSLWLVHLSSFERPFLDCSSSDEAYSFSLCFLEDFRVTRF
ncbi:hypothetical protein Hanom_Chr10g00956031 [Helianthus anomalus]